eukprot:SAG31_NODE_299_length_18114_cov_3.533777_14_plen_82_part_00
MLREFDLTGKFGPSVGVKRLDRWRRAEALHLNPPPELKELLERHACVAGVQEDVLTTVLKKRTPIDETSQKVAVEKKNKRK